MSTELYRALVSVTSRLVVFGLILDKNHIAKISELVLPEPQPHRAAMIRSALRMPAITSRCKSFNANSLTINLDQVSEQALLVYCQTMRTLALFVTNNYTCIYEVEHIMLERIF